MVPGRRNYASTLISDFDDNFNAAGAVKVTGTIERELTLVQYHDKDVAEGIGRNLRIWKWWTIPEQANAYSTIDDVHQGSALLPEWGARNAVSVARIPAGSVVDFFLGTAKQQISDETKKVFIGNGLQFRFRNFDPSWIVTDNQKLP